jgi:excisionase family DNA binding protein
LISENEKKNQGDTIMGLERRWLTARETSEYLHLSLKGVYKACSGRKIPFTKISGLGVRVDKLMLDALLARLAISPKDFGKSVSQAEESRDGH